MKISIVILCLFPLLPIYAQTVVEGKMYIEEASTVMIDGDVVIDGNMENHGGLTLTGDVYNTGSFISTGAGSLFLTGNQQIFTGGNYEFSTLKISDDYITQFNDAGLIEVSDSLILENGIVSFDLGGQMVLSASTVIVGGSESSFVGGPLFQEGDGDKFFPIGTEDEYTPLYLNTSSSRIGVQAKRPRFTGTLGDKVFAVSEDRLWELIGDQSDVTSVNSIQLPIKNETFIKNFYDIIVTSAVTEDGVYTSRGKIELVETNRWSKEGYVTANLNGFSPFISIGERINYSISIKNMITPNGDGKNDFLYIENIEKFSDYEVVVLNGWGQEVFRSSNYANDWDTYYNGQLLPTGAYNCIVTLNEGEKSGTFSNIVNVISK